MVGTCLILFPLRDVLSLNIEYDSDRLELLQLRSFLILETILTFGINWLNNLIYKKAFLKLPSQHKNSFWLNSRLLYYMSSTKKRSWNWLNLPEIRKSTCDHSSYNKIKNSKSSTYKQFWIQTFESLFPKISQIWLKSS